MRPFNLPFHDYQSFNAYLNEKIYDPKSQRKLVLIVVCIALLLDNMLYMVIVPIIPVFLRAKKAREQRNLVEEVTYENVTDQPLFGPGAKNPTSSRSATVLKPYHKSDANDFAGKETVELINTMNTTKTFKITRWKFFYNTAGDPDEDTRIGWLFAIKAIVQLCMNFVSGGIIDRFGYDRPTMFGLLIIFLSTTTFAFGDTYEVLFFARGLQGVGSAFADTGGLAMIADRFPEEKERSRALGIANAFISFGSLVAPPFGGILYQLWGKYPPFLTLALVALADGFFMMVIMKPVREERLKNANTLPTPTPIYRLLMDPYIATCAGCLVVANISLAFLEPTIALWMKSEMDAKEWQMGLIWFPPFFPHVLGVYTTVKLSGMFPRHVWLLSAIGLTLEGLSCVIIPFCSIMSNIGFPFLNFAIFASNIAYAPVMGLLWRIFKYKPIVNAGPAKTKEVRPEEKEDAEFAAEKQKLYDQQQQPTEGTRLTSQNSNGEASINQMTESSRDRWEGVTGFSG